MSRKFSGRKLDNVAFPMGGIGAGAVCLEGTGSFGSVSTRNEPNLYLDPNMFAAVSFEDDPENARVLEGQVPINKVYGYKVRGFYGAGMGMTFKNYGLPRFRECEFTSRFPFAEIALRDETMPVDASITGYSPFIPGDADSSSLPAASVEYTLKNKTEKALRGVFYFSAFQFMGLPGGEDALVTRSIQNGFIFEQLEFGGEPSTYGAFAISTETPARVNADFYRGGWWDGFTTLWNDVRAAKVRDGEAEDRRSPGGAVEIPFSIGPKGEYSVTINMNWYSPVSTVREGCELEGEDDRSTYKPWYAGKYSSIEEVVADYALRRGGLLEATRKFTRAFYNTDLPETIVEAVAANLSILKSPTVLRQTDGRFWGWEGSCDAMGSCAGSCNHVWNYAQALSRLFPKLERSMREVEFDEDTDENGHQEFRSALPIRKNGHNFYAAADGQFGGIMKTYREWRISGDTDWIRSYWDKLVLSMEYCVKTWDPDETGALREPRHNTYDIEFWGADPMCSSFYLGALTAMFKIGTELGKDVSRYGSLYKKAREYMETKLWNGEYFHQITEWETLRAKFDDGNDPIMKKEGPKYQYGTGCLSDGVAGAWLAKQCGLGDILDPEKTKKHLLSVYKYNFRKNLYDHANTERPGFAVGSEGGVVVCSWPRGNRPSLPMVYADEVFTGIEYQVASHLASFGFYKEAEEIVSATRARYDGERRNPYDEYECGHWYARAMASYGLIEAFSGVRYDAVTKTLYAREGSGKTFLAAETGFGTATAVGGAVAFDAALGNVEIKNVVATGPASQNG